MIAEEEVNEFQNILEALLDFYETQPEVLIFTTAVTAFMAGGFLWVVVKAITRAGQAQPPRNVLALLVALVGLVALIGVILRPEVDSLAVAAGGAIGALGAALAASWQQARNEDLGIPPQQEDEEPQKQKDEGDEDA